MKIACLMSAAMGLALASCAAVPPGAEPAGPCPIIGSSDWAAWVNAMPGPNARPALMVTGKVMVPTAGYTFAWHDLRVMESYPVQIVAELRAIPPQGPATQGIVAHDVRGEWPMSPPVGSFTVRCGDMVLARVAPVETAR